jgi:hypothetical protein
VSSEEVRTSSSWVREDNARIISTAAFDFSKSLKPGVVKTYYDYNFSIQPEKKNNLNLGRHGVMANRQIDTEIRIQLIGI